MTDLREVRGAWFSAMTGTALGAVGMALEIVAGRGVPDIPNWPAILSITISAALFLILVARRRRPNVQLAAVLFVLNSAVMGFALLVRDPYYAILPNWMPFQANKLACVVAALLAPRLWAACVAISLHALSALVALFTITPALRHQLVFEPTATLVFAFVGVVLALYRMRRLALEHEVAAARAEQIGAERLARTVLAVRDLANTPIQTIELCNELLKRDEPGVHAEVHQRLQRAIERLRELSALLQQYEAGTKFREEDASIESAELLEIGARSIAPGAREGSSRR